MMTFFCRLIPPRPTFMMDMTPAEAGLMQQHVAYWGQALAAGHVVAFGPVADPAGGYGIGVVQFADEAALRAFADNDPTIKARQGFGFEAHPMPRGVITPKSA